jgi:hypothetical protein
MDEQDHPSRIGAAVVAGGVLLVLLGLVVLPWYRVSSDSFFAHFFAGAGGTADFGEVHSALDRFHQLLVEQGIAPYVSFGVAGPYFSWLGWALAAVATALGALAVSPIGDRRWTPRWLAAVAAFTGGGVTVTALDLVTFAGNPPPNARPPSFAAFTQHTSFGPWVVVAGYTLILGGVFAPHRPAAQDGGLGIRFTGVRRK